MHFQRIIEHGVKGHPGIRFAPGPLGLEGRDLQLISPPFCQEVSTIQSARRQRRDIDLQLLDPALC